MDLLWLGLVTLAEIERFVGGVRKARIESAKLREVAKVLRFLIQLAIPLYMVFVASGSSARGTGQRYSKTTGSRDERPGRTKMNAGLAEPVSLPF